MKTSFKLILLGLLVIFSFENNAQTNIVEPHNLKPDPEKEQMFLPYLAVRHGGLASTEIWKKSNTVQYYKELWYYCESFYVKRNHLKEGVTLNEEIVDISRFEYARKENEEAIVVLPGFRDVLVLLPANKLVYKP
jgi:hypothetical protein